MASVSHSEVEAFTTCRRRHHYSYTRSLTKVSVGAALALGSAGHKVLEAYYTVILAAGTTQAKQRKAREQAEVAAHEAFTEIIKGGFSQPDNRADLETVLFGKYFRNEPFVSRGWRILAVEKKFSLEYDSELQLRYPFVVDLIAIDPDGKVVVVDHKFVYNFYSPDDTNLMPQIPKYIGALRALNHKVDYGMYNMLRTYKIKAPTLEQSMKQTAIKPNGTRVKRTFIEQARIAQDIQALKLLTPEEADEQAYRTSNKMVCQYCDFRDLCATEMVGGNTRILLATEYKTRERQEFEVSEDA